MRPRHGHFEQLYSSPSDRKKQTNKKLYNKHQNTIDMLGYQAVTHIITCILQNKLDITYNALILQQQQIQREQGKLV